MLSVCTVHVTTQARMYSTGNLGCRRRKQSSPEIDLFTAARMRGTVLPSSLRKRRLPRVGSAKYDVTGLEKLAVNMSGQGRKFGE